jgi:subtilisin family serine protease
MRDWHHNIIRLNQALLLISQINPQTSLNRVVIGIADGGFIEFESLNSPSNGLSYRAANRGLFKTIDTREKSSLINLQGLNVSPELNTATNFNNAKNSHATRVAGIALGNKRDQLNSLLPLQGIIEDGELMSFTNGRYSNYIISSVNNFNFYNENGPFIDANYQKWIFGTIIFDNDSYIPDLKNVNVINSSITYLLDNISQATLKVVLDVLKTYGNNGRGVALIAGAGNSRYDTKTLQGFSLHPYPIIVSASTLNGIAEGATTYSAIGDRIDLCAPSNNGTSLGIYTTTHKYCGEIGTDEEVITKTITTQSAVDRLKLDDVDFLFSGNCVELGNPSTNNHEVIIIKEVDRVTKEIIFTQNRVKTAPPYNLASVPASGGNPEIPCIRIPIIRTTASIEGTSRNKLRIDNNNRAGFGYVGQKIGVRDPSVIVPNPNPTNITQYFYTEISAVNGTNFFEILNPLPANMSLTGLVAVPSQAIADVSSYQAEPNNGLPPENLEVVCQNCPLPVFDSFIIGGMVEVFDTSSSTIRAIRSIKTIDKLTKTIVLEKYDEQDVTLSLRLRSVGYGSYTSSFGGTSAAAPVVSGIVGLMLKVNNNLNALEVKHILKSTTVKITGSSQYSPVSNILDYNYGYSINNDVATGNKYFGTGRVDAEASVQWAKDWHAASPPTPILKPNLWIADRMNLDGSVLQSINSSDTNQTVNSPDIWIKKATENTPAIIPTPTLPLNSLSTSDDQKIYIRVRNQGNRKSFKGCDLRVFVAFTNEINPAFPFPTMWYEQINIKLLAIKEIPIIEPNSETIISIDWKDISLKWNAWNPINNTANNKRKKAYLLAHIAPFDGENDVLSLENIRNNKQLTCKELVVNHTEMGKGTTSLPGNKFNIIVGETAVAQTFDLAIENALSTGLDMLKIKATKKRTDNGNVIEDTVFFSKTGPETPTNPGVPTWVIEGTTGNSVSWIEFAPPVVDPSIYTDHTDAKFTHTLTVNDQEDEVKIEVVTV